MLFAIVIIIFFIGLLFFQFTDFELVGPLMSIISGVIGLIMLVIITISHVGVSGSIRSMEEDYKGIMYKAKTTDCRDEFGILNKAFVDEIQEWNKNIASGQEWQHDPWVGIFFSPVYDKFEIIDFESLEFK